MNDNVQTEQEKPAVSEASGLPDLLPCPFCGSDEVEDDYSYTRSTFTGTQENPTGYHEYQDGWVDCKNCGAGGPFITAKDDQIDRLSRDTREAWNRRVGAAGRRQTWRRRQ